MKSNITNHFKYLLIGFFLCIGISTIFSQSKRIDWNNIIDSNEDAQIFDVIEASNGFLVAVGETKSDTKGGKDGLVLITDFYSGAITTKLLLGGKKDDVIQSVVQHWDGTLWLAGYTASKGKGQKDAWLVNINLDGKVLWENTYGSAQSDAFKSVVVTQEGEIAAVGSLGSKNGQAWLVILKKGKIIAEYQLGEGQIESVAEMVVTSDDELVLTGITKKAKGQKAGDAWLLKTNLSGQTKWLKFYGGNDWDEALALTVTSDNSFAIAGLTKSKGAGDMDMWLIRTNRDGELAWDKTYGGSDEDIAHGIVQTYDGGFGLIGITKSHIRGARRYNMSLVKTDRYGMLEWEENFGDNKEDIGNCITQVHDGSLYIGGGTTTDNKNAKNAWTIKTTASKEEAFALANLANQGQTLSTSPVIFKTENNDKLLKPSEKAYLLFELKNNSEEPLLNVRANVAPLLQVVGVQFWENIVIGDLLPKERKTISIPISATDLLQKGISTFNINLLTGSKMLHNTNVTVSSNKVAPAAIAFGRHHFNELNTRGTGTNYRAILQVNIQNLGEQSAKDIKGEFILPPGIKTTEEPSFTIDYLRPNSTHVASFGFLVNTEKSIANREIPVKCVIKDNNGGKDIEGTFTLKLNEPNPQANSARSPRSSKDLIWISPNPDESGKRIISDKEYVDIKVKAVSNNELKAEDFTIYLNNNSQDGSKPDKPALSKANRRGATFTQTYENRVQLKIGTNIIDVEVEDEEGNVKTVPLTITYAPERPNLHILAIGPSHKDLKYTGADAKDFAEAFRNQSDKLFNKVFIRTLAEEKTTRKDDIKKALIDLQINYQANTEETITDKDLIIVFISSHAKQEGRNFLILPSDYDPKYESIYTLNYEQDIIQYLANINCKKLMFIDACNSGSAYAAVSGVKSADNRGLAQAINTINSTVPGMSTVTSCQKQEKSYEDDAWQNGAFTESILEAFTNKPFADESGRNYRADTDSDGIINLGELSTFLQKRVPNLVKVQKQDAPTSQVPKITNNELGNDFPIYVLDQ